MDMNTDNIDLRSLEAPPAIATVRRAGDGFKTFQVVHAGFRSGLFDWLERHGPAEKSAIATALKLRGAHLGGFLQALEDLGLLARRNNFYTLAPGMDAVLCAASPWCQAEVFDDLLAPSSGWSDLGRFLSEGWTAAPVAALPPTRHPFLGEARRVAAHLAARHGGGAVRRSTSDALAALADCLSPGGELCCAHWFCLEACETAPGGLRDLDKAVLTDSHPLCHVESFCQRLEGAGLICAERDDLIGEYGTTKLHFARCPGVGVHRGN